MYDELIEWLRTHAKSYEEMFGEGESSTMMRQAADAIEKLSRRETPMKIAEIHVDEYYCPACGAENNCDEGDVQDAYCPACGQRLLPDPLKEDTP